MYRVLIKIYQLHQKRKLIIFLQVLLFMLSKKIMFSLYIVNQYLNIMLEQIWIGMPMTLDFHLNLLLLYLILL